MIEHEETASERDLLPFREVGRAQRQRFLRALALADQQKDQPEDRLGFFRQLGIVPAQGARGWKAEADREWLDTLRRHSEAAKAERHRKGNAVKTAVLVMAVIVILLSLVAVAA